MKYVQALSIVTVLALAGLIGCQSAPSQSSAPSASSAKALQPEVKQEPKSAGGECVHAKTGECGGEGEVARGADNQTAFKDPSTGKDGVKVGQALGSAKQVKISELLATPEKFEGQVVKVEGDVSAMCHHRRAWFAVQETGDRSGNYLRVLTSPEFLVPAKSIGKVARAEGKVELVNVPEEVAKHHAEEHKLGNPEQVKGPVRKVVLRATGAEFL